MLDRSSNVQLYTNNNDSIAPISTAETIPGSNTGQLIFLKQTYEITKL
jgi:hypothetical protein